MSVFGFCNNKCKHEVYTKDEVKALLLEMKPIGSIEFNTSGVNPSTYLGGTWESWGSGRVPVGVDTTQDEFATVEQTGGEKAHTLTIDEMPKHTHKIATSSGAEATYYFDKIGNGSNIYEEYADVSKEGGNQAHNNLQPYITCYMWKRTE